MVRSCESSLAVRALERFHTRVLSHVPRQLIRSRKLPVAALPAAFVRLLPSMCSLVRLQVGALSVDLVAAGVRAAMDALVSLRRFGVIVDGIDQFIRIVVAW